MTVTVRLMRGIGDHFAMRASEWLAILPSFGVGLALHVNPDQFSTSTAYGTLARWMSEDWWSVLFLTCAVLRLGALVVNGTFRQFRHSPLIRWMVAAIAAISWGAMFIGFFLEWMETGRAVILTALLAYVVAVEMFNCFRSSRDRTALARG